MIDMPYFMTNEEWFFLDAEKRKYVLTEKAPEKAKNSYEQYYKELSEHSESEEDVIY